MPDPTKKVQSSPTTTTITYRALALTSAVMYLVERRVLSYLRPLVYPSMDPLQLLPTSHYLGVRNATVDLLDGV